MIIHKYKSVYLFLLIIIIISIFSCANKEEYDKANRKAEKTANIFLKYILINNINEAKKNCFPEVTVDEINTLIKAIPTKVAYVAYSDNNKSHSEEYQKSGILKYNIFCKTDSFDLLIGILRLKQSNDNSYKISSIFTVDKVELKPKKHLK